MINGTTVTIVGRLGADPESRFTQSGKAVVSLNVAVSTRKRDAASGEWKDANVTWYKVTAWERLAENCAASLTRGATVMVTGSLILRSWESGEKSGQSLEITADAIGCELSGASATVKRNARSETTA